ncbi:MAG: uroporphyrinogen decarboxylase family protein [Candidatus Hodarchaeota archaeon]
MDKLSKEESEQIPLYCTGYPEIGFIKNYIDKFGFSLDSRDFILLEKNYDIIKQMGFDAVSIWDFRRGEGGYKLDNNKRVDGWGRVYKEDWYLWDGVFKSEKVIDAWEYLKLPSSENLKKLKKFLQKLNYQFNVVLSLPGLFEKTWQSMGFLFFSKCLKNNNIEFIKYVLTFFTKYLKKLIKHLQNVGTILFLIADDFGYKNREFLPIKLWRELLFDYYKEIISRVHQRNHKVIIHSDGYISPLLIDTFIELGFDAIQSLEPNAGNDIYSLFKKFTNQICFIGNIDISLLIYGKPIDIKQYTLNLITNAKKYNALLIVSPTQQINSLVSPENIKSMIETTKNYKKY